MTGRLNLILTTGEAGKELEPNQIAELKAGKGIMGDRYFTQSGTFSDKLTESHDFEVTLIELEEINDFLAKTGFDYQPNKFRRNLVTTGIRLNPLVGKDFMVGEVKLHGMRFCEPCQYLSKLIGREVLDHMMGKAGLRARIISSGNIKVGDAISEV